MVLEGMEGVLARRLQKASVVVRAVMVLEGMEGVLARRLQKASVVVRGETDSMLNT